MHRSAAELDDALPHLAAAPTASGTVELIVRRPATDEREVLADAELDPVLGLVGDDWSRRPSRSSPDGGPHPERQLTLMSARVIDAIAGTRDRWPLAGDQLYVDLALGGDTLPPGSRLRVGRAVLEVTPEPHTGCAKFRQRFGADALRFVNSPTGRELNLRGVNARVVTGGSVQVGDRIEVEAPA